MTEPLQFDTRRLKLRLLRPEDAAAISAYRGLPEVARYQSWETFGLEDAARLMAEQLSVEWGDTDSWLQLMIILSETGESVGDCDINFTNAAQQVELGITLNPHYQHRGFAYEAIEGVLEYAFGRLNMHRASATTDADNKAAHNLFQRLGFRLEGQVVDHVWFKGAWGSEYVFAMLQREWLVRPKPDHPLNQIPNLVVG